MNEILVKRRKEIFLQLLYNFIAVEITDAALGNAVNAANCLELSLKPQLQISDASMSVEQSLRAKFWNLRSIELEITGSIRSDLPLPLRF